MAKPAAVALTPQPRVRLADIESAIAARYDFTADKAIGPGAPAHDALKGLSICIVVMKNGYTVLGQSAESPDAATGRSLAYASVLHQLYPLMGFALRSSTA